MKHHPSLYRTEAKTIGIAVIVAFFLIALDTIPFDSLTGQSVYQPMTNVFRPAQTEAGVVLPAGDHNMVAASGNGTFPVTSYSFNEPADPDYRTRFWAYEFAGGEPPYNGKYYIGPEIIRVEPRYAALSTLTQMQRNRWYYVTTDSDLYFKAGQGIGPAYNATCTTDAPAEAPAGQTIQVRARLQVTGRATWTPGRMKLFVRAAPGTFAGQQDDFVRALDLTREQAPNSVAEFSFPLVIPATGPGGSNAVSFTAQIGAPTRATTGAYRFHKLYGQICNASIRILAASTCPNGRIDGVEGCDDNNREPFDGCGPDCQREPGFTCSGTPSRCEPLIPSMGGAGQGSSTGQAQSSSVPAPQSSSVPAAQSSSIANAQSSPPSAGGSSSVALGACWDSDLINPIEDGYVLQWNGQVRTSDLCVANIPNWVKEQVCAGERRDEQLWGCPLGTQCRTTTVNNLSIASCQPISGWRPPNNPPCTDSDGGINPRVRGTAQGATYGATDSCAPAQIPGQASTAVVEHYCTGGDGTTPSQIFPINITVRCPAGTTCNEGACL